MAGGQEAGSKGSMTRLPPILLDEARDEFIEASGWYEQQRTGLGRRFIDAVEGTLEAVAGNPRLVQAIYRDVRRATVGRFPYGVFYRIERYRIRVLSISHLSRDPRHWKQRR